VTIIMRASTRAVVARGLAAPDRTTKLAAVAVAVDEGVDTCAPELYRYIGTPDADPLVVDRIREVCSSLPETSDDEWIANLRVWARPDEQAAPPEPLSGDPHRTILTRITAPAFALVDAAALALLALAFGNRVHAFSGFPKGYDAWGHIAKVHLILEHWPYIDWNDAWYAGIPHFEGSYPPLYHLLVAAIVSVTGRSIGDAMDVVTAGCVIVTVVATYAFVRTLTSRRLPALAAGLLLVGTPAFWVAFVQGGLYPRLLAFAFLTVGAWRAAAWAMHGGAWRFACAALATGLALSSHLLVGVLALGVTVAVTAFASSPVRHAAGRAGTVGAASLGLAAFFFAPYMLMARPPTSTTQDFPPSPWPTIFVGTPPFSGALAVTLVALCIVAAGATAYAFNRVRSPYRLWIRDINAAPPSRIAVWLDTHHPVNHVRAVARDAALRRVRAAPAIRVAAILVPAAAVFLVYATAGHVTTVKYFVALAPADVMQYVGWFLICACTLALGAAVAMIGVRAWPLTALAVGAGVVAIAVAYPTVHAASKSFDAPETHQLLDLLPANAQSHAFRIAAAWDAETEALNARLTTPQVRGYQAEGRPNQDWQAWLEETLKDPDENPLERRFLLDWYGVKWVYAGPTERLIAPFASDKKSYRPVASGGDYSTFEVNDASAIATPRSTRTALVIGDRPNYQLVLRALADSNANSEQLVPIRGGAYVDKYSLAELNHFDVVVMYGWHTHSRGRATRLLTDYVRHGGGLVVEAAGRPAAASGPEELWPVRSERRVPFLRTWDVRTESDPATAGVTAAHFAAPVYDGHLAWETAAPTPKKGATTILTANGTPLIVRSRLGAGAVVWSGFNLPYHAAAFKNLDEARLFAQLISTAAARKPGPASGTTRYVDPQHIDITATDSRGVLVKENLAPDWGARVDGRPAKIYAAGLDFMWIPLDGTGTHRVELVYRRGTAERLGELITILTLVLLLLGAVGLRVPAAVKRRSSELTRRLRGTFSPV
jgi:hypothetical protein